MAVLSADERSQLEHHIRSHEVNYAYSCSIIRRLIDGAEQEPGELADTPLIDEWWRSLTNEERYELIGKSCHGCGSLDTTCQCWNDE